MHLKKAIKEQEIIIMQQCLKPYAFTNSNGRINYYYLEMENLMKDCGSQMNPIHLQTAREGKLIINSPLKMLNFSKNILRDTSQISPS